MSALKANVVPASAIGPLGATELDQLIGARVKLRRLELRRTQAWLGAALGVSRQQVLRYERGQNRLSLFALLAISTALEAPIGYFLSAPGAAELRSSPLLGQPDAIALLVAFRDIRSARERRAVIALARQLASAEDPG